MDWRTYGRTDGHLRPTVLGTLGGVALKISVANSTRCSWRWQTSPRWRHQANWTKRNVVLHFGPSAMLCEHMTSSTKPTYCTVVKEWPSLGLVWHVQNIWWNLHMRFSKYASGNRLMPIAGYPPKNRKMDKHTDRHADRNTSPTYRGRRSKKPNYKSLHTNI